MSPGRPRILLTGGSGFIGTNLAAELSSSGEYDVLVTDVRRPRLLGDLAEYKYLDVTSYADVQRVIGDYRPTHIVHLAARTDLRGKRIADYTTNYRGTEVLADAVSATLPECRVLFFSSRLVFDIRSPPRSSFDYSATTPYGVSKMLAEQIVRRWSGHWVLLRPTSLWGPWFSTPYSDFFKAVRRGYYVHPWPRRAIYKQFGYVGNAVAQVKRFLAADGTLVEGNVYWLADYEPLEVGTWATEIARLSDRRSLKSVPVWALQASARLGDVLNSERKPSPLTSFRLDNLLATMLYDTSETESLVGPLPFTWKSGTRLTVEWMLGDERRQADASPRGNSLRS